MGLYGNNPNSQYAQMQNLNTHKRMNSLALDMPGYAQYGAAQKADGAGGLPSSYADKFAGQFNPADMLKQIYGGGGEDGEGGAYGPIGAKQLKEYGEGAYELFDKFKPGMEHIAENQGVGEQELANMLGTSSAGYAQNVADADAQQQRQYGRMGIDPSSGAYAAGEGSRAMQGAAGLSGLQQNVRQDARNQDWSQRMQAAGIGLQAGSQGTDALGKSAGLYGQAASQLAGMYGDYMGNYGKMLGMDENARQFGQQQDLAGAQFMAGARPALDQTFYGKYQPAATYGQNATPSGANSAMAGEMNWGSARK